MTDSRETAFGNVHSNLGSTFELRAGLVMLGSPPVVRVGFKNPDTGHSIFCWMNPEQLNTLCSLTRGTAGTPQFGSGEWQIAGKGGVWKLSSQGTTVYKFGLSTDQLLDMADWALGIIRHKPTDTNKHEDTTTDQEVTNMKPSEALVAFTGLIDIDELFEVLEEAEGSGCPLVRSVAHNYPKGFRQPVPGDRFLDSSGQEHELLHYTAKDAIYRRTDEVGQGGVETMSFLKQFITGELTFADPDSLATEER